ncbi:MAG: GNAT family N-acetyltransferase [bacterium]|nr:GNAT family N-acetyltransferase [bacterium]
MKLEYMEFTSENFHLHEVDIMSSEEIFPEEIRETSENYLNALKQHGAIGLIARLDSAYVGNVIGFSPSGEFHEALRMDEVATDTKGLIYLYNIVTMPEFRAKGYGRELLDFFIKKTARSGFSRVGGHFRNNGSLKNFKNMGGDEVALFEDWFGTGEDYIYCELPLSPVPCKSRPGRPEVTERALESASLSLSHRSLPA